ncbi:MAG: tripartite tricarboxylate transporter substrate binding protein [Deltaproteobacteria bacterium]|nr:tripartite tricarboxylate transporter substrate binding protein [Deltaproteobacteria bacterium]
MERRKAQRTKHWTVVGFAALFALGAALVGGESFGASYPDHTITLVVPFKPGGGVDTQGRILANYIKKYLPKEAEVIVENQPTAGGKVGLLKAFDAKPDGYTMGITATNSIGLLLVRDELGKRNPKELTYFCRTGYAPYMVVFSARSRFKSIKDLKGQQVKIGGTSSTVFQAALLAKELSFTPVFITYDGFPETAVATMRGDVDLFFFNWDSASKHITASEGKLQPVFVASERRVPELSNVPTAKEIGINISQNVMEVMASGNTLFAPPNLPADVRAVLEKAVSSALNDPELESKMRQANYTTKPVLSPKDTKDVALGVYETYMAHKALIESIK